MKNLAEEYKTFISEAKTERECVSAILEIAHSNGFKSLESVETLKPGDKVYVQKFSKAIALFTIGSGKLTDGMNILGAHLDSPRLDIKPKPLMEKDFVVYMNTHYYGGIKKYQWVTLPLALHGVVCLKNGDVINISVGEKDDDPVFCISDILPHLAYQQMKLKADEFISGESLDIIVGSGIPESGAAKDVNKKAIIDILQKQYGFDEKDLMSAELEVVPAGKARDLGFDRSLILGYGHDDRSCAFASLAAFIDEEPKNRTMCCLCVDKEEIGSVGVSGMASHFFENVVAELLAKTGDCSDLSLRRCLAGSMMLSSDVNAAFDPQNVDLYDRDNSSFLGSGLVLNKYTGSRGKSGASDANPEYIAKLRKAFDDAGVPYQMAEMGKVDVGGGGTIAYMAAKYGMDVLDAGVAVLSMHSPWEIISKEDLRHAYNAYRAFLCVSK